MVASSTAPAAGDLCPACQCGLVSERQAQAWCAGCEWNLGAFEPARRRPELGWRWMDRLTHRVAYRLTQRQFLALAGGTVSRPGWGTARWVLTAAGVLFLAGITAALLGGAYLTVEYWPHPLAFVGLFLVLLALGLRPRLGTLDRRAEVLDKTTAPTLVRLVERIAAELGTRPPDVIVVDHRFNASCSAVGVRRTRVLTLGLPLWATLTPQQRVALLAHELGHFLNGDLRNGMLTWLPVTTLQELAYILRPESHTRVNGRTRAGATVGLAQMVMNFILYALATLLRGAQVAAVWVALRDGQRAEYHADQMAARVAGTTATVGLMDTLLGGQGLVTVIVAAARRGGRAADWRTAADHNRATIAQRLNPLRQLSVRDETSLFASHPPTGLRARLLESQPHTTPSVVLTDTESEQLDQELNKRYDRAARDLIA